MPSFAPLRHAYPVYPELGRAEFWDLVRVLLASSRNFVDARFQPVKNLYMIGQSTWPGAGLSAASGYLLGRELVK